MLVATLVTLIVLTDKGATWNHLVDLAILVPLAAAELVGHAPEFGFDRRAASAIFLGAATLGLGAGYLAHFEPQLGGSLRGIAFGTADPAYPRTPLSALVSANETLLSQDASIAVARDRRPAVLDPYMLRPLLDAALEPYRSEGVVFHAIRNRHSGRRSFLSMHVLVPGRWTVQQGHDLLERVEADVRATLPGTTVFTDLEPLEDPTSFDDSTLDRLEESGPTTSGLRRAP